MLFVCLQDKVVCSIKGHCIRFEKNKPTFVPEEMHSEVMAAGAVPVESSKGLEEKTAVVSEEEVKQALFKAFDEMMSRGRKGDFTAAGVPDLRVLSGMVKVPVTIEQRDRYWAEYTAVTEPTEKIL